MKKIVVFIPAYNEEDKIAQVINKIPKIILGVKTQILVVNDGSQDKTAQIAQKLKAIVISHNHNLGLGKAFQTGLNHSLELRANYLVNIDADGQFNPKDIDKLLKPIINNEADFVSADRFSDINGKIIKPDNMSRVKFWGNILMAKLVSFLSHQNFSDVSCGFRAYNKKAILMLNLTGKFTYTQESFLDLATKGLIIKSVPIKVKYFNDRKSKIANNLFSYAWRTLKIIIRSFRDYKPFLFFFYLSLIPFVSSMILGIYLLIYYFNFGKFTPYKSLGFIAIYLLSISILLWIVGFLADMFVRLRMNMEKILYLEKLNYYKNINYGKK